MRFLRTASTRRLLAAIAGLAVAIVAGSALAIAASSGPVPPQRGLATAVHDALSGRAVTGISADVTFTNHLIDASSLQGSDPLLTGATGRLWLTKGHLRLELQSSNGNDVQVVVNGRSFWISDPGQSTVYKGTLPASASTTKSTHAADSAVPSVATIQSDLTKLVKRVDVSSAIPGDVAGQPAYTVQVSPKHSGGLLGSVQLAFDAAHGVPLQFGIYARGNSSPVLQLSANNISYGTVPQSTFAITPPSGSKVVQIASGKLSSGAAAARKGVKGHHKVVSGVAAVQAKLPFTLTAPSTLVGLPRQSVSLLSWGDKPAAMVTYGHGLGAIVVLEQTAAAKPASSSSGSGNGPSVNLPTVSINGASGTELDTALGTLVHFTRSGVGYTVLGSVPSAAADAAARAL